MAQKKPSKIILCHYSYPKVEELAEFYSNKFHQATNIVDIQNQVIAPAGEKLDKEFYFLNARIGKETHIITTAGQRHYPSNDPAIVAKIEAYLAGLVQEVTGNANKHSTFKPIEHAIEERLSERTYLQYHVADLQTATRVIQELRDIYSEKVAAKYTVEKQKHAVRVTSWYLTEAKLRDAIDKIVNSQ